MYPSEANTVELDDFGGAFGGAIGGFVKWYQEPSRPLKAMDYASSLLTSVVGAGVCGFSVRAVVEWQYPDVPHTVTFAISMLSGLASSPILQSVVGLASVAVGRIREWLLHKLPQPPVSPNGTAPATDGQQPKN